MKKVIVVTGASPADKARAAEYEAGPYAGFANQVFKGFSSIVPAEADVRSRGRYREGGRCTLWQETLSPAHRSVAGRRGGRQCGFRPRPC